MLCRWYWIICTTLQNIPMLTTAIANSLCAHPDNEYIKVGKLDLHGVKNQIFKADVFERTKRHKLPNRISVGNSTVRWVSCSLYFNWAEKQQNMSEDFDFGYSHNWPLRSSPSLPPACWARQCPATRTY